MGRKENIKRMRRMREERLKREAETQRQLESDRIADDAIDKLRSKLPSHATVMQNTGPVKYSDVLKEFVAPFLHECSNFEEIKELFTVGALAWNMSITKQIDGEETYKVMIRDVRKDLKVPDGEHFLNLLVDRKTQYFAHYRVIFSNVEVINNKTDIGISVAVLPLSAD